VAAQSPELHGPPAYYTQDWDAAAQSVARLAGLLPSVIATGHGLPMSGREMTVELQYLAEDFDRIARPARGRYVRQPAIADERGLVSVPPEPAASRIPKAALISLAAGTLLLGLLRGRRAA
jgi:hypothetical protein